MIIKKGKKLLHSLITFTDNQCNHTLDEQSTLVAMPRRTMVYPPTQDYYCSCCKKVFKLVQDAEGHSNLIASL